MWQYYKDEPNVSNIKDIEIKLPLKFLSNFWRSLEGSLINYEVNPILILLSTCVITNSTSAGRILITETKLHVPVVTLSSQF